MKKKIIINGKETNYSVTDDAHIFNDITGKELKGTYSTNEYHSIQLVIEGKPKTFMFHRLVAEAFCENPNGYTIVDHIDRDKHNDNASNLRWVTASTNAKNCVKAQKIANIKYQGDFNEKQWYPVWNHPNYVISEDCEVVSLKTSNILRKHERNGYYRVCLDGSLYSLHKVLLESVYQQDLAKNVEIDHIDGDKKNNNLNNLKLVNREENMSNAYKNGHKGQVAVTQYSLKGEYINSYSSIREAAKDNHILEAGLRSATVRHGTSGGYYWLRNDDPMTIEQILHKREPQKINFVFRKIPINNE